MLQSKLAVLFCSVAAMSTVSAGAAVIKATYNFDNSFAAAEAGAPAAVEVDPLGASTFSADTVFGVPRTVFNFAGDSSNADQSGFTVNTAGLVNPESYSVDMVFKFNERDGAWRRILDVQNRQSDNGFYVDPSNNLDVFPVAGSSAAWTTGVYHHVVMTTDGTTVSGYIDGVSQFSAATALMNLDVDPASNPSQLLGFFLDNVAAGGQGEWSSGSIALARIWDGVLTPQEAAIIATNPFVPEPGSAALFALPGFALLHRRRRA